MLADLKDRVSLWLIHKQLAALEGRLFNCIVTLGHHKSLSDAKSAQLHLVLKAASAARAAIVLLARDFRQEAEAPQRAFLEAWVYAMHFTWFPGSAAFDEWQRRPDRPLDTKTFRLRDEVELEVNRRLDLSIAQQFPVRTLFRIFSNISIHPTRDTVDRAWEEVAGRRRFRRSDPDSQLMYGSLERIKGITKTATTFVQLHLFYDFLRKYVLSGADVPRRFVLPKTIFAESLIRHWLREFSPYIEFAFRVADEGYGRRRP
ncbi:MAG TPA: hypothetical protein VGR03_15615 [Candidatus Acidoferrum sp.]|nr:hypothetical protein [Candidatus Acidoferrum sp.]